MMRTGFQWIVLVDEIVAVLEVLPFADAVMVRPDRSELRLRFACVDDSGDLHTDGGLQETSDRSPQPSDTLAIFDSKTPYFCVTKSFRNSFLLPNAKARVDNDAVQAVRVDQLTSQA
jgi:hypothetical protein